MVLDSSTSIVRDLKLWVSGLSTDPEYKLRVNRTGRASWSQDISECFPRTARRALDEKVPKAPGCGTLGKVCFVSVDAVSPGRMAALEYCM